MQLLSPQTLLRAPFVDGLTEQVGKSLISREEQKREAYFFFSSFPRVCLAGRSLWLKKGEWWLVLVWRQKEGLCFGLESGSGSLLFLALPLQWVAGALLIFFLVLLLGSCSFTRISCGRDT